MTTAPESVEARIGRAFGDRRLLAEALTHRSFAQEEGTPVAPVGYNERLEFLGDAVVDLAVAQALIERLPDAAEGRLSTLRAAVVNERSLAAAARALDLGGALRLGRGEEQTGGREKPSILADAFEALVGAVFLDAGWPVALTLVRAHLAETIDRAVAGQLDADHKTRLQERLHRQGRAPRYAVTSAEGPDHARTFAVEVSIDGAVVGRGRGPSKKEAEQMAAAEALDGLSRTEAAKR